MELIRTSLLSIKKVLTHLRSKFLPETVLSVSEDARREMEREFHLPVVEHN